MQVIQILVICLLVAGCEGQLRRLRRRIRREGASAPSEIALAISRSRLSPLNHTKKIVSEQTKSRRWPE